MFCNLIRDMKELHYCTVWTCTTQRDYQQLVLTIWMPSKTWHAQAHPSKHLAQLLSPKQIHYLERPFRSRHFLSSHLLPQTTLILKINCYRNGEQYIEPNISQNCQSKLFLLCWSFWFCIWHSFLEFGLSGVVDINHLCESSYAAFFSLCFIRLF